MCDGTAEIRADEQSESVAKGGGEDAPYSSAKCENGQSRKTERNIEQYAQSSKTPTEHEGGYVCKEKLQGYGRDERYSDIRTDNGKGAKEGSVEVRSQTFVKSSQDAPLPSVVRSSLRFHSQLQAPQFDRRP